MLMVQPQGYRHDEGVQNNKAQTGSKPQTRHVSNALKPNASVSHLLKPNALMQKSYADERKNTTCKSAYSEAAYSQAERFSNLIWRLFLKLTANGKQ